MAASVDELVNTRTIEDFRRDGVVCLRDIVDAARIASLRSEIESFLDASGKKGFNYTNHTAANGGSGGRFVSIGRLWLDSPALSDLTHHSALPAIAARLLGAQRINLYFDQCFVKEPGTSDPTPWHNDQPYWPLKGSQVVTLWVALDEIPRANGAVEFVRGSHLWEGMFQPQPFNRKAQLEINPEYREMIDVEARRDELDIVSWDMQPGDALAFAGMTLHGARGNTSAGARRRGYSIRYTGSDVIYDPRPGNTPALIRDFLTPGQPIDSREYPVVWRAPAD